MGPYRVAGEYIHSNITDSQTGVPLHLDIQFVDVSNWSGVSDMLIGAWHCNATGVYSGVSATGQGGLNSTCCRGAQQANDDGIVEFDTIFPGHYTGRATHIHVKSSTGATIYDNNTYVDGATDHIGQLFFAQDLISSVKTTSPYATNEQGLTFNIDEDIAWDEATEEYDPFVEYVLLGDSISDGVLAWITVGVNMTADSSSNSLGGGPGGNGTAPSGSGAPPSATNSAKSVSCE